MISVMVSWSTTAVILALTLASWGATATPLPGTDGCPTCFPSPDGVSDFISENYYLSVSFKTNWHKAHQFCLLHGMILAKVDNNNRNDEVIELLKRNDVEAAWLGLSDLAENDRYNQVADGHYELFSRWAAGQPDHKTEGRGHCVLARATPATGDADGKVGWFNADCAAHNSFVCSRRSPHVFVG